MATVDSEKCLAVVYTCVRVSVLRVAGIHTHTHTLVLFDVDITARDMTDFLRLVSEANTKNLPTLSKLSNSGKIFLLSLFLIHHPKLH